MRKARSRRAAAEAAAAARVRQRAERVVPVAQEARTPAARSPRTLSRTAQRRRLARLPPPTAHTSALPWTRYIVTRRR